MKAGTSIDLTPINLYKLNPLITLSLYTLFVNYLYTLYKNQTARWSDLLMGTPKNC